LLCPGSPSFPTARGSTPTSLCGISSSHPGTRFVTAATSTRLQRWRLCSPLSSTSTPCRNPG
ncbi:unnamed protein product, partial [Symbiodinium sp. CCMP2456]